MMVRCLRFTPAHAGNTVFLLLANVFPPGSPPLTRGIRFLSSSFRRLCRFTPAHAGNTGFHALPATAFWVHPRSRGEYISPYVALSSCPGSPPLTRGIPVSRCGSVLTVGFTPAHAGNTPAGLTDIVEFWVHPRSRGEYGSITADKLEPTGSPPLTRGIL